MTKLNTTGIFVSSDFPIASYNEIHRVVADKHATNPLYEHFGGAWNAIGYRFLSMVDSGDAFVASLAAYGDSPEQPHRYRQERQLFEFYSCGFSIFESAFYGLFAIAGMIRPAGFSLSTPRDQQRVTPSRTAETMKKNFQGDGINTAIDTVMDDPAYQQWREIRNILTHRAAPGRRIYVGIGSDEELATEWKVNNLPLSAPLVTDGRADLTRVLEHFLDGIERFTMQHL